MKKHTLALFSLCTSLTLSAQEVIATQGDSYTNANGSIDFTIGEVVIATGTDGTNDLTQGFHQTNWNFLGLENHIGNLNALVYPNPMDQNLTIELKEFEAIVFKLYDAQGRIVAEGNMESEKTLIPVDTFAPGAYSLILFKESAKLKTFKLVKNQ